MNAFMTFGNDGTLHNKNEKKISYFYNLAIRACKNTNNLEKGQEKGSCAISGERFCVLYITNGIINNYEAYDIHTFAVERLPYALHFHTFTLV